jgi:ABC-type sulfate transport system substrate-binding protein
MKLISITASDHPDKKLMAVFDNDGRTKTTHFGAKGMDDYTITHDKEQRARYRERHAKDLKTGDPTRAGYLSYEILWGDSTSRQVNIRRYRGKHNL